MEIGGYNVQEKYSPIVAPNFYFDSIFQPGLTYSDQYQGDATGAGAVKIFKLAAKAAKDPKAPASDFEHGTTDNELIPLLLNNAQQESTKIYNGHRSYYKCEHHLKDYCRKKGNQETEGIC